MKRTFLVIALLTGLWINDAACQQTDVHNTWTYTYLKAREGQQHQLKKFLEQNWFVMDSIAVQQGLFNDYSLIRNNDTSEEAKWDFIVAVEYFTRGTYADIETEWLPIRQNHETVLIDGKSLRDLGEIIDSQQLRFEEDENPNCTGERYDILKPFLGNWKEYTVNEGKEDLFGLLKIEIDPKGCSLRKEFQLLTGSFSYSTLGYFDNNSGTWKETFSTGSVFEWVKEADDVVMVNLGSKGPSLHRNRWTSPKDGTFQIIEERSENNGKTWVTKSVTKVKKIGSYQ